MLAHHPKNPRAKKQPFSLFSEYAKIFFRVCWLFPFWPTFLVTMTDVFRWQRSRSANAFAELYWDRLDRLHGNHYLSPLMTTATTCEEAKPDSAMTPRDLNQPRKLKRTSANIRVMVY